MRQHTTTTPSTPYHPLSRRAFTALLPMTPLCHRVVARQLVEVASKVPSELLVRAQGIVKGLEAREAGERALEPL